MILISTIRKPERLMKNLLVFLYVVQLISAQTPDAALEIGIAAPFVDNAVLQQGIALPVWGKTQPGAKVTVMFKGQTKTTTAQQDGSWKVVLVAMSADRLMNVNDTVVGETMILTCEKDGAKTSKEIDNLILGDVWYCAGQSNMAGALRTNKSGHFPEDTLEKANYPALRQFSPGDAAWVVCSPETAPVFKRKSTPVKVRNDPS